MSRELSKTIIVTGCNTDNPNFQWYKDLVGHKFKGIHIVGITGITYYRIIEHNLNSYGVDIYINSEDCAVIEEWRNNKIESIING